MSTILQICDNKVKLQNCVPGFVEFVVVWLIGQGFLEEMNFLTRFFNQQHNKVSWQPFLVTHEKMVPLNVLIWKTIKLFLKMQCCEQ